MEESTTDRPDESSTEPTGKTKAFNPLLYNPLKNGEIRVLCLEPSSLEFDESIIRCSMRPVKLDDIGVTPEFVENETAAERQWKSSGDTTYDYSTLFKPRRGLLDRSLKKYIKSLKTSQGTDYNQATAESKEASADLSDRYMALSYVWGSVADKKTIKVNGVEMLITQNLHAALLELRKSMWVRRRINLWIDALCINQDNLDEREEQVKLMRDIYSVSWQVVVFLGPAASNTDTAYTAWKWLLNEMGSDSKLLEFATKYGIPNYNTGGSIDSDPYNLPWHEGVFEALRSFFACQYWHRLWILQELAMAKMDAPVLWGGYSMSLRDLWAACELLERQENIILRDMTTDTSDTDRSSMVATVDRRLGDREGCPGQQYKHLLRIKHIRDQEHQGVDSALPALELARQAQATEPSDKVYGILGIPCVKGLTSISPNYRIALSEVYTNFTQEIILNNDHGLDILRLIHSPVNKITLSSIPRWLQKLRGGGRFVEVAAPCSHNLPSWVVCWSCTAAPVVFLPGKYTADFGLSSFATAVFSNTGVLTVKAIFLDSIATLSAFNSREEDKSYPKNCTDAFSLPNAYGSLEGIKEAFWRSIVANSDSKGEKPPQSWAVLSVPRLWSLFGTTEGSGGGLEFGLHGFAQRNKDLVICGIPLKEITEDAEKIKERRVYRAEEKNASEDDKRKASAWAANVLAWRRLIGTRNGRVGLTVAAAVENDKIAILPGCSVPLVLRREGLGWKIVGECFVYGLMDGETADIVASGQATFEKIELY